ncbi:MAG: SDR family NAD(P)-dependent oxidoreductase [Pseudomonadota bacterium]
MTSLTGKRAIIIGSSTGIGAAVAARFADSGAEVCITYYSSGAAAEELAHSIEKAGGKAHVMSVDAADPDQATGVIEKADSLMGGLDIVVNNAGLMFGRAPLIDASAEQLKDVLDLNVGSVFYACQAAGRIMSDRKAGCIINTSSIAARTGGGAGVGVYGSAKAFVSTYTRVLARELAPFGVRANAVAPGVIRTAFHERYSTEEQLEAAKATIPMGRLGTAEDCAGAYLFLADDTLSGYITGQIIEVNGGQLMP